MKASARLLLALDPLGVISVVKRKDGFYTEDLAFGYGKPASYSGKISQKTVYCGGVKSTYHYTYDKLGRLTDAAFERVTKDAGGSYTVANSADFGASYTYDLEANLLTLRRHGLTDVNTYGLVNDLAMTYEHGQLKTSVDHAEAALLENNLGEANERRDSYTYDPNGNLTKDTSRNITSITYNALNLPETITFTNGSTVTYQYASDGTRLSESTVEYQSLGGGIIGPINPMNSIEATNATLSGQPAMSHKTYAGSYEFTLGMPQRLLLGGGYLTLSDNIYHHYITDYQGNVVLVINTSDRSIEQQTGYYPYGMPHGDAVGADVQPNKYSCKRLQTFAGMDTYDFHARQLPIGIPRFDRPDPMGEKRTPIGLYVYCDGNPINLTDLIGEAPSPYEGALMSRVAYKDWSDGGKQYYEDLAILAKLGWRPSKTQTPLVEYFPSESGTGYQSMLFERETEAGVEYAYAFAGTDSNEDQLEDITQVYGASPQIYLALAYALKLHLSLNNAELTFVGHSFGGAQATAAAIATGRLGMVYNAASLSNISAILPRLVALSNIPNIGTVINYVSSTPSIFGCKFVVDPLTIIQDLPIPIIQMLKTHTKTEKVSVGWKFSHFINDLIKALR